MPQNSTQKSHIAVQREEYEEYDDSWERAAEAANRRGKGSMRIAFYDVRKWVRSEEGRKCLLGRLETFYNENEGGASEKFCNFSPEEQQAAVDALIQQYYAYPLRKKVVLFHPEDGPSVPSRGRREVRGTNK